MTISNHYPDYQNKLSSFTFYGGLGLAAATAVFASLGFAHQLGALQDFWNAHKVVVISLSAASLATGLHALHEGIQNEKIKKLIKIVLIASVIAAAVGLCLHHQHDWTTIALASFVTASILNYVAHNPRGFRTILCRIFHDFWQSAHSYYKGTLQKTPQYDQDDSDKTRALEIIRKNRMTSATVITEHCALLDRANASSKTISDLMFSWGAIPTDNDDKKIIRIPVVLQHFPEKHIVGIIIDKTQGVIKLFDPKGETAAELGQIRPGLSMLNLLKQLCQNFKINKVEENTTKHQKDCHNCGVHVLQWFKGGNLNQDPIDTRIELMKDLIGNKVAESL